MSKKQFNNNESLPGRNHILKNLEEVSFQVWSTKHYNRNLNLSKITQALRH